MTHGCLSQNDPTQNNHKNTLQIMSHNHDNNNNNSNNAEHPEMIAPSPSHYQQSNPTNSDGQGSDKGSKENFYSSGKNTPKVASSQNNRQLKLRYETYSSGDSYENESQILNHSPYSSSSSPSALLSSSGDGSVPNEGTISSSSSTTTTTNTPTSSNKLLVNKGNSGNNVFEKQQSTIQKQLNDYQCNHKDLKHLNILLIGEKGAGKSSLLSTFHRALHSSVAIETTTPSGGKTMTSIYGQPPIAGVGTKRTEAFTKKKKGYKLNVSGTLVGHDTRGLETYLPVEIEQVKAIRDGRVLDNAIVKQKSNWSIWDYFYSLISRNPASILDPSCLKQEPITLQDLPHAVIFVVPANQRMVPKEIENFVSLFVEYGYKPLFAITKIDCHGGQAGDIYAATQLYDTKKQQLMELLEVEYSAVKPIQNYTQWDKKDLSIENLALDLLWNVTRAAEQFIRQYESQLESKNEKTLFSQIAGNTGCAIS